MPFALPYPKEAKTRSRLSPQFNGDEQGPTSSRYYNIPWSRAVNIEAEALGYPERIAPGVLSRHLPERDPQKKHLWAVKCGFDENMGAAGYETVTVDGDPRNVPKFNAAQGQTIRVDYSWLPYDVHADADLDVNGEYGRFVEIQEDSQCDIITSSVLSTVYKWAAPGIPSINGRDAVGLGISKPVPFANVTMIWHQVPYVNYPRSAIQDALGKVSKADLGTPGDRNYYAAGTLLFLGCRRRRYAHCHNELTGVGQAVVDLQYYFRHDKGGDLSIAAGNLGPNTFPCFLPEDSAPNADALGQRVLITTDGIYQPIGARDDVCVFNEFTPMDLFTVE